MSHTHLILLGDSVFDNQAYVAPGQAVATQLQRLMQPGGQLSLLAVDGHVSEDVSTQLRHFPPDASHIALSVGGNDALGCLPALQADCANVLQALESLAGLQQQFNERYRQAFHAAHSKCIPMMVCTIYDAVPGLPRPLKTALSLFNDVITRTALEFDVPILDLRTLLSEASDYSGVSPIEPSEEGGAKIAAALAEWVAAYPTLMRQLTGL